MVDINKYADNPAKDESKKCPMTAVTYVPKEYIIPLNIHYKGISLILSYIYRFIIHDMDGHKNID